MSGISLTFPIGEGRTVTVTGDTPPQLYGMIDKLGGNSEEISTLVGDALNDPTAFGPELFSAEIGTVSPAEDSTPAPVTSVSDPWADESLPDEPADDDPWSEPSPTTATKPSSKPSPSSRNSSAPASGSDSHENKVFHDRFERKFHHGLPDAPTCAHNLKAAKMTAKKRSGKGNYSKWVCPKVCDGTSDGWKDKCDYEEWAS